MARNLKALGLAFVAVVAMSALVAASASANYTSTVETTHIHGTQTTNHVFKTSAGAVTCKKATFTKNVAGTTKEAGKFTVASVTVHPTYSECTGIFPGAGVTVKTNACNYEFQAPTEKKVAVKVVGCAEGAPIEIVVAGFCTMTVGNQSPTGNVTFTNEGSGSTADVKATAGVTGISYAGNCGSGSTGTYEGTTTVKGYTSEAMTTQVGIEVM